MRQLTEEYRVQAMTLHLKATTREREILSNEIRSIIDDIPRDDHNGFDQDGSSLIAFKRYHDLREKRMELEIEQACYFLVEQRVEGYVNEEKE